MTTISFWRTLALLFISFSLQAQQRLDDCTTNPTAQADLDVNAVRARITNGGDLWWNGNDPGYAVSPEPGVPSDTSAHILYNGGLWLAGLDSGGDVIAAAQSYGRSGGKFDYYPGPLDENGNTGPQCSDWDRLFEITRTNVDSFLNNYDPVNPDSNAIPVNIAGWPATGNPLFVGVHGFELPAAPYRMAPFFDSDNDGLYNPSAGDYPLFCGDQAIWAVFNDSGLHRQSNIPGNIKAEIHLLAYAFAAEEDDPLNRTTFYQYRIRNRAEESLMGFYAGHFIDSDVGCYKRDGMTSAPERSLFYTYNPGGVDSELCPDFIRSFKEESPVNIFQVVGTSAEVEDTLLHTVGGIYDGGSWEPQAETADPGAASAYFYRMTGLWNDGTPIKRGGNGFWNAEGEAIRYLFDGGPIATGRWDYCSQGIQFPDSRLIYSTGPYNLEPEQTATFTLAVTSIFGVTYEGDCPDTTAVYAAAQQIKDVYDNSCAAIVAVGTDTPRSPEEIDLEVFPNPAAGNLTFRLPVTAQIDQIELLDVTGRTLATFIGLGHQQSIDVKAAGLVSGLYFYRLRLVDGTIAAGRLVVR
jgi:hypothetical protein